MKEFIDQIVKELNNPEYDFSKKSYKIVTETIKTLFVKKGVELGYCSAAHQNTMINTDYLYDEGEWMFDFIWYKMSVTDNQIMESIPLVLESELSRKDYGGLN